MNFEFLEKYTHLLLSHLKPQLKITYHPKPNNNIIIILRIEITIYKISTSRKEPKKLDSS